MKSILKYTLGALSLAVMLGSANAKEIVDVAGRTVDIPDDASRIVLGEGRMIYGVMVATEGNPFAKLVGWGNDLVKADPDTYKKLAAKFPEAKELPTIGKPFGEGGTVNLEALINLKPDVYLLNIGKYDAAKSAGLMEKLEEAGIATVFVDFRQHALQNTVPSMLVLGDLFNSMQKTNRFISYYRKHTANVYNRVRNLKDNDKPVVFVWRAAGFPGECCMTFGSANYGRFVEAAGGVNWGSAKFKGFGGDVNPEVLTKKGEVDMIIATSTDWSAYGAHDSIPLGYDETEQEAEKKFQHLMDQKIWQVVPAVQEGKAYAIYHQFYNSPYNFIALEVIGKWMHPALFKDIDPVADFKAFHKEFLPIDYSGVFWVGLDKK